MDYSRFQVAIIEIASEGTRLTTANVVSRLRIDPKKAEKMLDQMARDGRLDLEVDETEGVVVYSVRGLTPPPSRVDDGWSAPRSAGRSSAMAALAAFDPMHVGTALAFGKPFRSASPLPPSLRRSVPVAVVLGFMVPGLGLAYAAPWTVVALTTAVVIAGFKLLPLLLGVPFLLCAMLASAILGGLYAHRYNQTGRRAPLAPEPARLPRVRSSAFD